MQRNNYVNKQQLVPNRNICVIMYIWKGASHKDSNKLSKTI